MAAHNPTHPRISTVEGNSLMLMVLEKRAVVRCSPRRRLEPAVSSRRSGVQ
jgi:hypothetical protein